LIFVPEAAARYFWQVAPSSQDLALRYLLELSADIRLGLLWDRRGELLGSAPGAPERLVQLGGELAREAASSFPNGDESAFELDVSCDGGAVFLIRDGGMTMLCLTERSVLPGLIFYDMHAVLRDLDRAADAEGRRRGAAA
jgi:hypothetical protein